MKRLVTFFRTLLETAAWARAERRRRRAFWAWPTSQHVARDPGDDAGGAA